MPSKDIDINRRDDALARRRIVERDQLRLAELLV